MFLSFALFMLVFMQAPDRPEPAKRLEEWAGKWVVASAGTSSGLACPDDLIALAKDGAEVAVNGNELRAGDKVLGTLTTDFTGTGLDLDSTVWLTRRPVLLTTPSGHGVLCAYEVGDGYLELCYPHTQRRVGAGTRIVLKRPKD